MYITMNSEDALAMHPSGWLSLSSIPKPVASETAGSQEAFSDEQLVAAILKLGSQPHFRMLVARYQSRVHAIALSVLGPGRQSDAQDVAQEIFVRVYRQLDRFRGQSRFSTWLYRISVNLSIDYKRQQQRHQAEELDRYNEPVSARHAEHERLDQEKSRLVTAAIQNLEPRQQLIVRMFYWQGFKTREIAEILDSPEGTIKVNLLRARNRLATMLEDLSI